MKDYPWKTISEAETVFLLFINFQEKRKKENLFFSPLLPTRARSDACQASHESLHPLWTCQRGSAIEKDFIIQSVHTPPLWISELLFFALSPPPLPLLSETRATLLRSDLVKDYFEPNHSWCNLPLCCSEWKQDPDAPFNKRREDISNPETCANTKALVGKGRLLLYLFTFSLKSLTHVLSFIWLLPPAFWVEAFIENIKTSITELTVIKQTGLTGVKLPPTPEVWAILMPPATPRRNTY